jgi:hypothetical protein
MRLVTFVGCAAYRTVRYSTLKYIFGALSFFQVEFIILFLRTDWSLSTYMKYGSIFTVHTHTDGTDGTGRDGRDGTDGSLIF